MDAIQLKTISDLSRIVNDLHGGCQLMHHLHTDSWSVVGLDGLTKLYTVEQTVADKLLADCGLRLQHKGRFQVTFVLGG